MPRDELRQPLHRRSWGERLWANRPGARMLASVLAATVFAGGATWLASQPYPFAGEPVVVLAIPPLEEMKTAATEPPQSEPAAEEQATPEAEALASEDQANQLAPEADQEEATIIVSAHRPLKAAPVAAVAEATSDGPLPRISAKGKKPADVYAQTTPMAVLASDRPRIAILLGGMGLNARLTRKAINQLPGDVSFGFAPYGNDLQSQVDGARVRGHEVMLQLPMEPMGYPAGNPGPNTLLVEASQADNLKALRWHMSRFSGYTGIVNYMGGRFLSAPESLRPMMAEMKERGLVFLQDASVANGSAVDVAKITGLDLRHGQVVIDVVADAAGIEAALAQLEAIAQKNGFAIGTGSGLEITIDTVAEWARQLESRGILLVPVSAVYKGRMS